MNTRKRGLWPLVVLMVAVLLTACAQTTEPIESAAPPTASQTELPRKTPEEYGFVITDRLFEPVEDYSGEREEPISMVMLHFCSAVTARPDDPFVFETIRDTFMEARVSAHYMIDRDGKVYRTIPEERAAWHAGRGSLDGREEFTDRMNHHSVGIELFAVGTQEEMRPYMFKAEYDRIDRRHIGYTPAQYDALNKLLDYICEYYAIPRTREHIVGHDEYSRSRTDPGSLFEWHKITG